MNLSSFQECWNNWELSISTLYNCDCVDIHAEPPLQEIEYEIDSHYVSGGENYVHVSVKDREAGTQLLSKSEGLTIILFTLNSNNIFTP